jgi:hypothetical protein
MRYYLFVALLAATPLAAQTTARDGSHDFDFEIGRWHAHLARLLQPLAHSATWATYDGTSIVRPVWGGRANLGELEVAGNGMHVEGMSFRLYDSSAHQWRIHWANSRDGALGPAMVGSFTGDRGEFYDQEDFNGRAVFVRFLFSGMRATSFKIEQAFSDDAGKSWETNWITTFTKDAEPASPAPGPGANDAAHDFDFAEGTWAMSDGSTHHMHRVWNGRAYLGELELKSGGYAGSLLHTYNPGTHQWSIYWADRRTGRVGPPMIGRFRDGVGEFYDQEDVRGVTALVRVLYTGITATSFRTAQSYSTDGGTTWQADGAAYTFTRKAP